MCQKSVFCILLKVLSPLFAIWAVILFFPDISQGTTITTNLIKTFQPKLSTEREKIVAITVNVLVVKGENERLSDAMVGRSRLSVDFIGTAIRQNWQEDLENGPVDIFGGEINLDFSYDRDKLWVDLDVCNGMHRKNRHKFRGNLKNTGEVMQFFKEQLKDAEYCITYRNNLQE